jgi:hypothetical protein
MSGKIYTLQDDGSLEAMQERSYLQEERLQSLLEKYPDLLAGDQINEEEPRRWLLLSREMKVPLEESGGNWMSLDHLFVDQEAIPTLIEVKRSSDTRIRREVVGQMLDYASHAVAYWSVEHLRLRFEAACEEQAQDGNQLIAELLDSDSANETEIEDFWTRVETNLQAGKIRLIFAADEIPSSLKRIVEFLNSYMAPVEVLAVEVRQYVGDDLKTLVPRVIGQTEQARGRKTGGRIKKRKWDEESFFETLSEQEGDLEVKVARKLLDWFRPKMTRVWWGEGSRRGSFVPILNHKNTDHQLFAVWTNGVLEFYFYWYQYKAPFDAEAKRKEKLSHLNALEGISLPDDAIGKRPSIPLRTLAADEVFRKFVTIFEWVIDEIKET